MPTNSKAVVRRTLRPFGFRNGKLRKSPSLLLGSLGDEPARGLYLPGADRYTPPVVPAALLKESVAVEMDRHTAPSSPCPAEGVRPSADRAVVGSEYPRQGRGSSVEVTALSAGSRIWLALTLVLSTWAAWWGLAGSDAPSAALASIQATAYSPGTQQLGRTELGNSQTWQQVPRRLVDDQPAAESESRSEDAQKKVMAWSHLIACKSPSSAGSQLHPQRTFVERKLLLIAAGFPRGPPATS